MEKTTRKDVKNVLKKIGYPTDVATEVVTYHDESWYLQQDVDLRMNILSSVMNSMIRSCYVHPVSFKMIFQEIDIDIGMLEDYLDEIEEKEIVQEKAVFEVVKWNWDFVPFPEITKLTVNGNQAGNTDARGGGCGNLNIPLEEFTWTVENPDGITLFEFTEGAYRMKGSKYDWWYELYSSMCMESMIDGHMTVEVGFGYGS